MTQLEYTNFFPCYSGMWHMSCVNICSFFLSICQHRSALGKAHGVPRSLFLSDKGTMLAIMNINKSWQYYCIYASSSYIVPYMVTIDQFWKWFDDVIAVVDYTNHVKNQKMEDKFMGIQIMILSCGWYDYWS